MARTILSRTYLMPSAMLDLGAIGAPLNGGQALDQGNGMAVNAFRVERLALLVYNSKAGAINVIVRASPASLNPPAFARGQGDLTQTIATLHWGYAGGFESSRFLQPQVVGGGAGTEGLYVDFDAGATGLIWAFELGDR